MDGGELLKDARQFPLDVAVRDAWLPVTQEALREVRISRVSGYHGTEGPAQIVGFIYPDTRSAAQVLDPPAKAVVPQGFMDAPAGAPGPEYRITI